MNDLLMTFLSRFETHLQDKKILSQKDRVWVACSGGPDSVALFFLLHNLPKPWKLKLGLLYFNHGLRPQAAKREQRFVQGLAQKYGVPFKAGKGNVKKVAKKQKASLEEAARELRYDFFAKTAKKLRIKKIALGHTQEDQAETVLMRIMQGTGLKGLSGIRETRKQGSVTLVRPLLEFSKRDIHLFLKENKIAFCRDASNQSLRFFRNRIRHELIPQLEQAFNPRIIEALGRLPKIVQQENEILEALENRAWQRAFKSRQRTGLEFDREAFLKFPPPLQFRVLDRGLRRLDPKSGLSFAAWQRLAPSLKRKRYSHSLPRDIDFALTPSKISIYKKKHLSRRRLHS